MSDEMYELLYIPSRSGEDCAEGYDVSFAEKSSWVTLVTVTAVFVAYFAAALPVQNGTDVGPVRVIWLVLAVVALALTQAAGHAVLAVLDRRTDTDERGRLIELRGVRNGAYVLATAVFTALCAAIATDGNAIFVHVLLAGWVAAQLVETGSQLVLYRRLS